MSGSHHSTNATWPCDRYQMQDATLYDEMRRTIELYRSALIDRDLQVSMLYNDNHHMQDELSACRNESQLALSSTAAQRDVLIEEVRHLRETNKRIKLAESRSQQEWHIAKEELSKTIEDLRRSLKKAELDNVTLASEKERLLQFEAALIDFSRCSICYDTIILPAMLSCGHVFCTPCITRWKSTHNSSSALFPCAYCRCEGEVSKGAGFALKPLLRVVSQHFPINIEDDEV